MVMSPAFHVSVPQGNINTYNEYSAKLVQQLKISDPHETTKCLKACCISAFIKSIYGVEMGNPENEYKINRLVEAMEKLGKFAAQRFASPWLYWDFTLHIFPSARRSLKLYNECCSIGMQLLEEVNKRFMQSKYQENSINYEPKSVAEVLLDHHHQDQSFSLEDVMHQTNALVATNSEGMSTTLMWCLFLLGHHPDIQEKVFEEVVSVTENDVEFSEMRRLTYLECVIKESSRLYTTFPMFGRCLKKDLQFGKYKIPENSTIIFASYILHQNPDVYPDPEKFNPDRFMEPNSKINEWTYVPFAEGIRSCLGKPYAIMALKVILCHVIRNFRIISLDRPEDVVLSWEIVLTSEKNLRIKFVPRKPSE